MRMLGKEIPESTDVYTALKTIKGMDTDNSNARIEKIITKAGCYRIKKLPNGKPEKDYPLLSELNKTQVNRLMDCIELPCAILQGVRMSPRKGRLVANLIRGKKVDEAIRILRFTPNKPADILLKVLKSALANSEANHGIKVDSRDYAIFIRKILIDGATTWKRFRPKARGRAGKILKRTSHVKIVLGEKPITALLGGKGKKKSGAVTKKGSEASQTSQNAKPAKITTPQTEKMAKEN